MKQSFSEGIGISLWDTRCALDSQKARSPATASFSFFFFFILWRVGKNQGNGQKRELPVGSWPETGGQKYEGSKHSIWAHVIGQHSLPPVSGRTPTGTSRFSLLWSTPTRFWPHFVAFCCSSPVYSIGPAWRRTTTLIPRPDDVGAGGKWEKGDMGSGHLGIPTAVNEAVQPPTIRNLNKN